MRARCPHCTPATAFRRKRWRPASRPGSEEQNRAHKRRREDNRLTDAISSPALTRRAVCAAGAALPLVAILTRRGDAAEFTYKLATGQDPTHPVNKRSQEAIDRIREATGGRLEIRLFPANQLGSDTDLLGQVRNGGVEFFNEAASILATLVPAAGIVNVGFAFTSEAQVWRAMDGALGTYIQSQIEKVGLLTASPIWANGFREITSSTKPIHTPADLQGFKIRVPAAPILTSLFTALGAGPTPINFNELYSALQTKLVEGQENPLPIIYTAKLFEVQQYCSLTNHVWDGYWILANRRAMLRLPQDMQEIVRREFTAAGKQERDDIAKLSQSLQEELTSKGLKFVDTDAASFRDKLKTTTFYKDWRAKFGDDAWRLLEDVVGPLT
ncbi:MAG: DctP family TRAP transporter solute-binding subunit [Acetobacteraceae bacterium]|nr:DctP family TRAP transporter solute-binding subunit [Acetobacteraceae bacterium]